MSISPHEKGNLSLTYRQTTTLYLLSLYFVRRRLIFLLSLAIPLVFFFFSSSLCWSEGYFSFSSCCAAMRAAGLNRHPYTPYLLFRRDPDELFWKELFLTGRHVVSDCPTCQTNKEYMLIITHSFCGIRMYMCEQRKYCKCGCCLLLW